MKKNFKAAIMICMALITAFAISLPGYSQKKHKKGKSKEKAPSGYMLQYSFPEGKPMAYSTANKIVQSMDINGEAMQTNVDVIFSCTVTSRGKDNANLKLEVKIDTLNTKIDSPMGAS